MLSTYVEFSHEQGYRSRHAQLRLLPGIRTRSKQDLDANIQVQYTWDSFTTSHYQFLVLTVQHGLGGVYATAGSAVIMHE